jgi:PAS domain S-box-containing protein
MGSQSDRSSDMMLAGAIANPILRLLICIAAVFVVTALLNTVSLRDRPLSAVLIFLFLVLIVSAAWGFHYALFVSLLAALGFSWLLPPVGRFWLSDSRDIFALAAFLVIVITTSHLSDRARREALSAKRAEGAARRSEEGLREVIETMPAMAWSALPDGSNAFANRQWAAYTGLSAEQTAGSGWQSTVHPEDLGGHMEKWRQSLATGQPFEHEMRLRRSADGQYRWFSVRGVPLRDEHGSVLRWYGLLTDVEDRKWAEALLTGEKRILEMVAKGDSLPQILDSVCRFVEEQASGFLASILLVDGNRLRHGVAPSLPKAFTNAIDGVVIGPSVGSCGTAAYRGEQVIVEDIATDPLWADYRELALPHSLRAAWSTPVFSSQGKVIATFAMYYHEPRSPGPREQETIEQITHLAGVAIERKLTQEALRRSEAYLVEAQRLTHTGSWAYKAGGGEGYWSEETFRIFQYDRTTTPTVELILQRVHREDAALVRQTIDRMSQDGKDFDFEHRLWMTDGSIKHLRVVGRPSKDESGSWELVGAVMDVSDRKRTEERLRRSEADLLEAQRLSQTGSWKLDVSSGTVTVSPQVFRIFGVKPDEETSAPEFWFGRNHPEDQKRIRELFERSTIQKTDYDADYRIVLPDGAIKHLHAVGHPVLNESGDLVEFVGTTMDVTEQVQTRTALEKALQEIKQRNEALRASEHNLNLIINTIPALVWSARPDGSAEFFNQHYLDYVGLSAEQAKNWGWTVAVHPDDLNGLAGSWQSIMASGKQGESEARLRRFDREYRWFLFRANPLRDESGNIVKWFGINTDIEDRKRAEEKLRRSERDLHEAQRITHTGSWRYDVSSRKVTNSPEGDRIYSIQPNEDASAPEFYFSRVHPDDRKRIRELFERCAIQKSDYQSHYAIVLPDGTIKHIHAIGHPVLNESGDLVEFVGTTMDITERKQTEEALRRSEAYLAEAQRMTHTGSWAWNVRTDALFWSQEIFRIYDCDPEMTPTWDFLLERAHPEDRLEVERKRKMEATQKEWADSEIDFRIVLPDGTIKHLHSIAHPVMDDSGEIAEVVGTVIDVTERKRAEEALLRSEAYLAEAQRLTHTGSWAHKAGGREGYWSEENFRIWGFDPRQGTPNLETLLQRIHPEDRDRVRGYRGDAVQARRDYDHQFRIVLPGGTVKHIQVFGHPVFSASGDLIEVVGTHVDVTERKRAEEERERLRQLEADLAHMNRVTMLGELASSLAHELNQPIAAAITSANACLRWLARNPPDLERARAAAMRIENDGSRAADIIQRLRAFYKTGAPPQRELVDLNEVAGEILALLRNEATRHSISLRTELAPRLPQITADRVQLQQVLMNLMLNGIEAMTDGASELIIRSQSTEDGFLLISVSDTGVGLPSEKLDKIFNAFYTTKPQGTGMGLPISRSIVEAHGGRLWATANAERGATFHFTLPAGVH